MALNAWQVLGRGLNCNYPVLAVARHPQGNGIIIKHQRKAGRRVVAVRHIKPFGPFVNICNKIFHAFKKVPAPFAQSRRLIHSQHK